MNAILISGSLADFKLAERGEEARLLSLGESPASTAAVAGAGAVYCMGSQEARSAQGVLSIRHIAGQGRDSARQERRQRRSQPSADRWRCRIQNRSRRCRRTGHPRPRLQKGRTRAIF